jgi:hypothetical protein
MYAETGRRIGTMPYDVEGREAGKDRLTGRVGWGRERRRSWVLGGIEGRDRPKRPFLARPRNSLDADSILVILLCFR